MRKIILSIIILTFLLSLTVPVLAQEETVKLPVIDCGNLRLPGDQHLVGVCNILSVANIFIFILEFLAIIYFIWGITKYLTAGGDDAKVKSAKNAIIYGIIGIGVIFGINAIINFVGEFLGVNVSSPIPFFK